MFLDYEIMCPCSSPDCTPMKKHLIFCVECPARCFAGYYVLSKYLMNWIFLIIPIFFFFALFCVFKLSTHVEYDGKIGMEFLQLMKGWSFKLT